MNRRIPTWIAMAASGVLVAASAMAQGQGNAAAYNPKASATAGQAPSASRDAKTTAKSTRQAKHAKARHKSMHKSMTTSSAGTSAAGGDRAMDAAMAQCASKTDRHDRAECARTAWESRHGTSS